MSEPGSSVHTCLRLVLIPAAARVSRAGVRVSTKACVAAAARANPGMCAPFPPCSFTLPNLRTDLVAYFVTGSKNPATQCWGCSTSFTYPTGTLTATSPVLVNAAPNHPTNVKLVPDQDPTKMSVQWQTKDAAQPQVRVHWWCRRVAASCACGR